MVYETEDQITYNNNHNSIVIHDSLDNPLDVYNIKRELIGYSWNYGDKVELSINLNDTRLHVNEEEEENFKTYLSDKQVEFKFTDVRGYEIYLFKSTPTDLTVNLKLNTTEDSLIERNIYKLEVTLIDPIDESRISLLKSYDIYVR